MPAYTCYAQSKAAITSGLNITLVDVNNNFEIDADLCEKAKNVGAILVVHPYGIPLNVKRFCEIAKAKSAILIEDCAQAYGAKIGNKNVGTFGDYSILSFRPSKHICGISGGAILSEERVRTTKEKLDATFFVTQINLIKRRLMASELSLKSVYETRTSKILKILNSPYIFWKKAKIAYEIVMKSLIHKPNWAQGIMSSPQTYLALTQLTKGKKIIAERNRIAKKILEMCENIFEVPRVMSDSAPSFIAVPLLSKKRNRLEQMLRKNKVYYERKYSYSNITLFPFAKRVEGKNSIRLSKQIITFPTDPFYAKLGNYDKLEALLSKKNFLRARI